MEEPRILSGAPCLLAAPLKDLPDEESLTKLLQKAGIDPKKYGVEKALCPSGGAMPGSFVAGHTGPRNRRGRSI